MADNTLPAVPEIQRKTRSTIEPETSTSSTITVTDAPSISAAALSRNQPPLYQVPKGSPLAPKKGRQANKAAPGNQFAQSGHSSDIPSATSLDALSSLMANFIRQQEITNNIATDQANRDRKQAEDLATRNANILLTLQNEVRAFSPSRGRPISKGKGRAQAPSKPPSSRRSADVSANSKRLHRHRDNGSPDDPGSISPSDSEADDIPLRHGRSRPSERVEHFRPNTKLNPLDDGKDVKYYLWKLQIDGLFEKYPHDFTTLTSKLNVILGATVGLAQKRLSVRLRPSSSLYIQDIEEVWELLEQACTDPNEIRLADIAFRALHMRQFPTFTDFLVEFESLAELSDQPKNRRRAELWEKISSDLKSTAIPTENQYTSYVDLAKNLSRMDLEMRYNKDINKYQKPSAQSKLIPSPAAKPTGGTYIPALGGPRRATPGPTRFSTPARDATPVPDHSSKQCYNCGQYGHISPNCPSPKAVDVIDLQAEINQIDNPWLPYENEINGQGKDNS